MRWLWLRMAFSVTSSVPASTVSRVFWDAYWKDPADNDKDNLHWRMKYNIRNRGEMFILLTAWALLLALNMSRGDPSTSRCHWIYSLLVVRMG